jgi:hypothetical protein
MYDVILIILGAAMIFVGARIVIKLRELSGSSFDEEERSEMLRAQLPQDLQELKIDEPQAESWDAEPPADQEPAPDANPPEEQP